MVPVPPGKAMQLAVYASLLCLILQWRPSLAIIPVCLVQVSRPRTLAPTLQCMQLLTPGLAPSAPQNPGCVRVCGLAPRSIKHGAWIVGGPFCFLCV
jgi:hypothetical protein